MSTGEKRPNQSTLARTGSAGYQYELAVHLLAATRQFDWISRLQNYLQWLRGSRGILPHLTEKFGRAAGI